MPYLALGSFLSYLTGALPVAFLLVLRAGGAVVASVLLSRLSGHRDAATVLGDTYGRLT